MRTPRLEVKNIPHLAEDKCGELPTDSKRPRIIRTRLESLNALNPWATRRIALLVDDMPQNMFRFSCGLAVVAYWTGCLW